MPAPTLDATLDAMLALVLIEDRALGLEFAEDAFLIRLPTTRRIAERLGVPHYYVLPLIGALEADGLLTRAERVGIRTTPVGTRRLFDRIDEGHRNEAEALLGPELYSLLLARTHREPNH
jgi:DNA-binding FadR family transcriptional regulator